MTIKIYCAINASIKNKLSHETVFSGHITLAFCEPKETDKLFPGQIFSVDNIPSGTISEIKYWPHNNLSVIMINSPELIEAQNKLSAIGFTYNQYDFIPHITIGPGDMTKSKQYSDLHNCYVEFSDFYIRIKDFN